VRRLLILGGTAEAAMLARVAAAEFADRVQVITSIAGRLPQPPELPGRLRVGGFGSAGLTAYLGDEAIDAVIDATHPFAQRISQAAVEACAATGVPRLVLTREPWQREPGDRWIEVDDLAAAAAVLPGLAERVFLAVGANSLAPFAGLRGTWCLVRLFGPPSSPLPLADATVVVARPPFSVAGETALLRARRIGAVVTKQSGGAAGAKLAAARALALPVVMIRRPPPPAGATVTRVEDALAWLAARAACDGHPPGPILSRS
jgi:precorrin-6A/cobalt-precorrin-6A reductase